MQTSPSPEPTRRPGSPRRSSAASRNSPRTARATRSVLCLVENEVDLGGIDRRDPQSEQGCQTNQEAEEIAVLGDGRALFLTHHDSRERGEWTTLNNVAHCGESW